MSLCKYANALGEPKKGIHSYRVFNIAIVDVIMTIFGGLIISFIFKISFWKTTLALFIIGIISHRLFCVKTTIDRYLFGN